MAKRESRDSSNIHEEFYIEVSDCPIMGVQLLCFVSLCFSLPLSWSERHELLSFIAFDYTSPCSLLTPQWCLARIFAVGTSRMRKYEDQSDDTMSRAGGRGCVRICRSILFYKCHVGHSSSRTVTWMSTGFSKGPSNQPNMLGPFAVCTWDQQHVQQATWCKADNHRWLFNLV